MTFKQSIQRDLEAGYQFSNERSNWYTMNNPIKGVRIICNNDKFTSYKTMDSYSKRVAQLINRG